MKRRDFLLLCASVAAFGPIFGLRSANAQRSQLIDIHCHIFNADDLPIVGFVEKVLLEDNSDFRKSFRQYPHAADFFVRYLANWLRGKAYSAVDEIELLDAINAGAAVPPTPNEIRTREIGHLADLIEKLRNLRIREENWSFGEKVFGYFTPGVIVGLMLREAFPGKYDGEDDGNSDGAFSPANWEESPEFVAQHLYDGGGGKVSRYVRWALKLTRYRFELADELDMVHGAKANLVTPALIDYSHWLNDSYDVKLNDQVRVVGRIARRKNGNRVHGFAPFDPLREALHRVTGKGLSSLALAQHAVAEEGFVGVKLYPPMGFLPFGNAELKNGAFHDHLQRPFRGRRIGVELDAALRDLYSWCAAEQVPLLAHASDSNGSAPGMSKRASPEKWKLMLEAFPDPNLRIALAHFGDFDEGFSVARHHRPKLSDTWEWKMGNLLARNPNRNIYVDISYFRAAMLERDHGVRKEALRMFKAVCREFPLLRNRLMFGSDWLMLGQEKNFTSRERDGKYLKSVVDLLEQVGFNSVEIEGVMFRNAVAFLGLSGSSAASSRERLQKFYQANSLPQTWLSSLGL